MILVFSRLLLGCGEKDCDFDSDSWLWVSAVVVVPEEVPAGGQVDVVWDSYGAESCRAGGTLPAWTDLGTLPLQGPVEFNVPDGTAAGSYRLDVLCERNGREVSGQSSENLIVLSSFALEEPSLSVSPEVIRPGDSVTVTWSSENATGCTAGGDFPDWSGSKAGSGSEVIDTSTGLEPDTYNLTLFCSNNSGDSPVAQVDLLVETNGAPACTGDRAPPPGLTRTETCLLSPQSGDCREFNDVHGEFPGIIGAIRLFGLQPGTYAAKRIEPMTIPADARADLAYDVLQNPHAGQALGPMIWSISTCPGDFNEEAITAEQGPGCIGTVPGSSMTFGGSSWEDQVFRCGLQSDTTYYLNILYTDQPVGTPNSSLNWFCETENCGMQVTTYNAIGW